VRCQEAADGQRQLVAAKNKSPGGRGPPLNVQHQSSALAPMVRHHELATPLPQRRWVLAPRGTTIG